jgi:hypothetical protein
LTVREIPVFRQVKAEAHLWRLGTKTISAEQCVWPALPFNVEEVSRGCRRRIAPIVLSAADSISITSGADSAT